MNVFEKIIEMLEEEIDSIRYDDVRMTIGLRKAIEIIQEEHNNGWIPCSEQMPEEDGVAVLLQDMEGNYSLGVSETNRTFKGFKEGYQWASAGCYMAWQPLPKPYKVEKE